MLVDVALVLAGAGALAATGTTVRDALADRALRGYQTLLRDGTNPVEAATAAQVRLREGALAWRDDLPEAWYRLGVHHMEFGDPAGAREAWRAGLASDPGLTEAWLDIAASYEREGRLEDARAALLAAARHDPTRYDVQVRLGHLALGAEPVPGDASGSAMAEIAAHRHYNEAERLAPDRFETLVARARIARRRGALAEAGALLRAANERRPQAAEILLESFRLEEVEKVAHELVGVAILTRALLTDPSLAGLVEREADRFLGLGAERAAAAKDAVAGSLTEADYAAADRAYGAAARRLAGLLHARVRAPGPELAAARAHEEAKEWRPALARLRAVLSWAGFEPGELGATRKERLHSRADLFLRTAQVAARVDGPLSRHLYARAHAAQGAYLLETKEWDAARNVLAGAVEEAPRDPGVRIAYARALVHTGELDAAEDALLAALLLDPALAEQVRASGEFTALLEREDVAAALAR